MVLIGLFASTLLVALACERAKVLAPGNVPASSAVWVGAGDIADCTIDPDEHTARLLDRIDGVVFTAGDNAYPRGTREEFEECYNPTWGRHRHRTRPSPGNHDYLTAGALPYFEYFGENAGSPSRSYYSYSVGAWHVISLDSNIPAGTGSLQHEWLRRDLAENRSLCTAAYWHHPVYNSGWEGNAPQMRDVWRTLHEAGVEVVVSGHAHSYERFSPQDSFGNPDPARGVRLFVVGTGGSAPIGLTVRQPNSEVFASDVYGVIKFTLRPTGYEWEFVPVPWVRFRDAGTGVCF